MSKLTHASKIIVTGEVARDSLSTMPKEQINMSKKRPNIILYVVDDLGMDDAGCYGNSEIKTPGVDMLAKNGTRFTNAYATCATCSASRSAILSGLHSHANGIYGHIHGYHHFSAFDQVRSLPNLLEEVGYRTATIGKYHVAPKKTFFFQQFLKGNNPKEMAETCKPLIGENSEKPFFLYFCTHEPHRPFKRDGSDKIDPKDVIVPPYLTDNPETREELAQYYMSAQRADTGLVSLIKTLKETGHWDDTIILFCSDNGAAFPGAKTNVYDPGVKLPFVLRNPFVKNKTPICNAMVSYVDITPTLLKFAKAVPKKYKFDGKSFAAIMKEEDPKGWDEVYASHTFHEITMYYPMRVVRTRKYKLIWNIAHGLGFPSGSDLWASPTWQSIVKNKSKLGKREIQDYLHRSKFELYNVQTDPDEIVNLATNSEYKDILASLQDKLKTFQKETKDPWKIKWIHE